MKTTMSRHARPEHRAAARMVGYALTCNGVDDFHALSVVLSARLDAGERARLAWAALRSLTPEDAEAVIGAVFPAEHASPLPSLMPDEGAARIWAASTTEADLKTHMTAAFEALPVADQRRFIAHVLEGAAA